MIGMRRATTEEIRRLNEEGDGIGYNEERHLADGESIPTEVELELTSLNGSSIRIDRHDATLVHLDRHFLKRSWNPRKDFLDFSKHFTLHNLTTYEVGLKFEFETEKTMSDDLLAYLRKNECDLLILLTYAGPDFVGVCGVHGMNASLKNAARLLEFDSTIAPLAIGTSVWIIGIL